MDETNRVITGKDIRKLYDNSSAEWTVEQLETIVDGYLPRDYIPEYRIDENAVYTEEQYDSSVVHAAMLSAIKTLSATANAKENEKCMKSFSFYSHGIKAGTKLVYKKDMSVRAYVRDDTHITYKREIYTMWGFLTALGNDGYILTMKPGIDIMDYFLAQ